MHPILAKFGVITIYSYGVMVAAGFGLASFFIYKRAEKFGLNKDKILDFLIIILVAGILGGRLLYVLLNFGYYAARPLEIPNLSKGGLVLYGGFMTALAAAAAFLKKERLNFWAVVDLVAPYLALGQAFGRIGCFFNGCCYGANGAPVQLYSSLALIGIFLALRFWQDARKFNGEIFLGYCMLYTVKRFVIEFIRADNPRIFICFTISQIISIFVFMLALGLFIKRRSLWKEKNTGSK